MGGRLLSNRNIDVEVIGVRAVVVVASLKDGRASDSEDVDFFAGLLVALDSMVTPEQNFGCDYLSLDVSAQFSRRGFVRTCVGEFNKGHCNCLVSL